MLSRRRRTLQPPERCETPSCWTCRWLLIVRILCGLVCHSVSFTYSETWKMWQNSVKHTFESSRKSCKSKDVAFYMAFYTWHFHWTRHFHIQTARPSCYLTMSRRSRCLIRLDFSTLPGPGSRCLWHPAPRTPRMETSGFKIRCIQAMFRPCRWQGEHRWTRPRSKNIRNNISITVSHQSCQVQLK